MFYSSPKLSGLNDQKKNAVIVAIQERVPLLLDENRKAEAVAAILLKVSPKLDESEAALLEMALTQYPPYQVLVKFLAADLVQLLCPTVSL